MNARERHEVGLELIQVDIEGTVEAQAGGDRANHLGDEPVEMIKARARDI